MGQNWSTSDPSGVQMGKIGFYTNSDPYGPFSSPNGPMATRNKPYFTFLGVYFRNFRRIQGTFPNMFRKRRPIQPLRPKSSMETIVYWSSLYELFNKIVWFDLFLFVIPASCFDDLSLRNSASEPSVWAKFERFLSGYRPVRPWR